MIVKKFLMIFLLMFCANNMFAQNELYNDIIYPDVGAVRLRFPPLDGQRVCMWLG